MTDTKNNLELPNADFEEITVDITGNVDSGKSTLVGILSHPLLRESRSNLTQILDDGNGSARARVMTLKHEQESGRTSSISYNYMVFDPDRKDDIPQGSPKVVSLVDLAGHETYLKTTITGVISSYPDHGIVLVAKNITKMTREHCSILASMDIPVLFVLTKTDLVPDHLVNENIRLLTIMSKRFGKKLTHIRNNVDARYCIDDDDKFGYIQISNKTGGNLDLLIDYISMINKRPKNLVKGFMIDRIYTGIVGFGLVVSGLTGVSITKGDTMVVGPFANGEFVRAKIRTIHNDYRHFVDTLQPNVRGCLCIRLDAKHREHLRVGMAVAHKKTDVNATTSFQAEVAIFRGRSSNIKKGYNSYINIGLSKGPVEFIRLSDSTGTNVDIIDTVDKTVTLVDMRFTNKPHCINIGDRFLFRSCRTMGIGRIVNIE
jgi:elongation factor 1-alpha